MSSFFLIDKIYVDFFSAWAQQQLNGCNCNHLCLTFSLAQLSHALCGFPAKAEASSCINPVFWSAHDTNFSRIAA